MIKINLIEPPYELTDEVKQQLTEKFKQDDSPVWKKPYIEKALLEMNNGKCAYSEQLLNTKSILGIRLIIFTHYKKGCREIRQPFFYLCFL